MRLRRTSGAVRSGRPSTANQTLGGGTRTGRRGQAKVLAVRAVGHLFLLVGLEHKVDDNDDDDNNNQDSRGPNPVDERTDVN